MATWRVADATATERVVALALQRMGQSGAQTEDHVRRIVDYLVT